ncbi:MAG: protein kinase [Jatrophihabitans sp.]
MVDGPPGGPPPQARADALVAGRYRLVERVASGGMGSVWLAWDEVLQRRVALKQLHPQPGLSAAEVQVVRSRAEREARLTARLHHPNAVPVYDIVDDHGLPCIVMQYLPSKNLNAVIDERGTLEVAEVARIGSQVAAALGAAHRVDIVHRDVKPGNVLIEPDGTAKLTDFGISHALGDSTLTSTGMITGTPAYLAPEVARGAPSGPSTDVFSLGATLYAALEGAPPFGNETNPMAMLHTVASGQINPPSRSGALTPVLRRMLSIDPADRPSMDEAAHLLRAVSRSADAPTEHLTAPMASVRGPSPTIMLPPNSGAPTGASKPDRRRLAVIAAVVAALIVALGVVLVTQTSGNDGPTAVGRASSPLAEPSVSRPAPSRTSPAGKHTLAAPTGAQLTQAIQSYYGLLPSDTGAAFTRLTPAYQAGTSGGRKGYDDFWGKVDAVGISQVVATPPGSVVATIRYEYSDGTTATERTSFTLVSQGGNLLINASSVQNSVTSGGDSKTKPDKTKPGKGKPGNGK